MRRFSLFAIVLLGWLLLAGCSGNTTPVDTPATPSVTPTVTPTPEPTQTLSPVQAILDLSLEDLQATQTAWISPTPLPRRTATPTLRPTLAPFSAEGNHQVFLDSVAAANGWEYAYEIAISPKGTWILGEVTGYDAATDTYSYTYALIKTDGSEIRYPNLKLPNEAELRSQLPTEEAPYFSVSFSVVGWTHDEDFIFLASRAGLSGGCGNGSIFFSHQGLYLYQVSDGILAPVNLQTKGDMNFGYSADDHYVVYIPQGGADRIIFKEILSGQELELAFPRGYLATTQAYWLEDGSGFVVIGAYYKDAVSPRIDVLKINYPEMSITLLAENISAYAEDVMDSYEKPGAIFIRGNGIENYLSLQNGELQSPFPTLQP